MSLSLRLENDMLEFRCDDCRRTVQAVYAGALGGIPKTTCRCPSCEGVETVKPVEMQGMPKHPTPFFRGS